MTNLKKRERAKTNASLISMVQRFSDITIMFAGLWLVCEVSGLSFLYMHLLVALITLVVFQMLGGITDFYRSWRGVRAATEMCIRDRFYGVWQHFYDDNFSGTDFTTHYVVLGFRFRVAEEELLLPDEQHDDYRWLTPDALLASNDCLLYTSRYYVSFIWWSGWWWRWRRWRWRKLSSPAAAVLWNRFRNI